MIVTKKNAGTICEQMLALAEAQLHKEGEETEAHRQWNQVYVTLCHLKVDLYRAKSAERYPEKWPEPAQKPPRTRFDEMPGEGTES